MNLHPISDLVEDYSTAWTIFNCALDVHTYLLTYLLFTQRLIPPFSARYAWTSPALPASLNATDSALSDLSLQVTCLNGVSHLLVTESYLSQSTFQWPDFVLLV